MPRPPARSAAVLLALVAVLAGPAAAKEGKGDTTTYTSFDTLAATLWRADGRRGVLTVQGGLDVQDPRLRARAAACAPILRDAYLRALNVYAQALTPGAAPDVDQIGMRLQRATDGVLRQGGARLLLGTVLAN